MFKGVVIIVVLTVVAFISFAYFTFEKEAENVPENIKVIEIGEVKITVEIADEPSEQMQGLSGRESMAEDHGMLFIFPQPLSPGFWMKEMKFSIDIIWIDQNGMIVGIEKNVSPNTYPNSFFPPSPIKYVLEVNAGWSDRHNIKAGDKIEL